MEASGIQRFAMRRFLLLSATGLIVGLGCGLLTPYPGGGSAAQVLSEAEGPLGGPPIQGGSSQDPLIDPAIDSSIGVVTDIPTVVALPGDSFVIDLDYVATRRNVLGGGIQFPDSDQVQWTLIDSVRNTSSGNIRFAYAVPADVCDEVASLCHEMYTQQFAVGSNITPDTDIDGDGEPDGEYVVSPPVEVKVVLKCASCESSSCLEALPNGECLACPQPTDCGAAYALCFAPGRPKYGTDEAQQFEAFFGINGLAWKASASCTAGAPLCADALQTANEECRDVETEGDTDTFGETDGDTDIDTDTDTDTE